MEYPFNAQGLIWSWPVIAAITALTLLGRLSTRFGNLFKGFFFYHSSISAFVSLGTDVGREGLVCSLCSNSSQMCSIRLRSGLCAGQSSSSTPNLLIHVFIDSFTGTKGLSPTPEKQPYTIIPPPPNFTPGTIQSGKYRSPGNCQTQTRPSDCQTEKCDSSLQRTHLLCSRDQ